MVAHSAIELYTTKTRPECLWRRELPSAACIARISYDSAYIASVGRHDKLVKVWRRLSYGSYDVRFDFLYLPHPNLVTGLRWRQPAHVDQTIDNILYTFCTDNVLRIWTGSDSHGHQLPQLWGKLNLSEAIQDKAVIDILCGMRSSWMDAIFPQRPRRQYTKVL